MEAVMIVLVILVGGHPFRYNLSEHLGYFWEILDMEVSETPYCWCGVLLARVNGPSTAPRLLWHLVEKQVVLTVPSHQCPWGT